MLDGFATEQLVDMIERNEGASLNDFFIFYERIFTPGGGSRKWLRCRLSPSYRSIMSTTCYAEENRVQPSVKQETRVCSLERARVFVCKGDEEGSRSKGFGP
jgi:hypothetical protein